MLSSIRRLSPVEFFLNLVFALWVGYFIATGYIVPQPLFGNSSKPATAEVQQEEKAPLPDTPLLLDEQS